jgi:hypothetical protein
MANTTLLKTKVEPYVRTWLAKRFGQPFHKEFLVLKCVKDRAAKHEFDAVSEDRKTVCGIKTASWKTSSGKPGAGKKHGAYAELYFLDHVEAEQKYLVLTDAEFYEKFRQDSRGKLPLNIDLLHCELPGDLQREVDAIRKTSRSELGF